jgi:hypothetical protein
MGNKATRTDPVEDEDHGDPFQTIFKCDPVPTNVPALLL